MKLKSTLAFTLLLSLFVSPKVFANTINYDGSPTMLTDDVLYTKKFNDERKEYLTEKYGANYNEIFIKNSNAVNNAEQIRNSFGKDEKGNIVYPNFFGGIYINDEDDLVIQLVKSYGDLETIRKNEEFANIFDIDKNANIEYVDYSQNELDKLYNKAISLFMDNKLPKEVVALYIDTIGNRVVIELSDDSTAIINKLKKIISDSNAITFKKGEEAVYTANINAGGYISPLGCSVGYRARVGSSGKGFVTAAHCASLNTTVTGFGVVAKRKLGGNMDAEWINSASVSNTPTNNWQAIPPYTVPSGTLSTTVVTSYTVGQKVGRIGNGSGHQTGKVVNVSWSGVVSGTSFNNLVSTDVTQVNGDSGGIVYYTLAASAYLPETHLTAGIGTIASSGKMVFSRADYINSYFGISRY